MGEVNGRAGGEGLPSDQRLARYLADALETGDGGDLRARLQSGSGLRGPRPNLRLVREFAAAAGSVAGQPDPPVATLEALLDGWAAIGEDEAPGDQPAVILPCAAAAAYGEIAIVRPEWWADEMAKLRRAAPDPRWRVREAVATALQQVLDADWDRTAEALVEWAGGGEPPHARAAVTAVAEPRLLIDPSRHQAATQIQRRAVARLAATPAADRRAAPVRALRQALGFTISVVTAASGDFALLDQLVRARDPDLAWVARENLEKARLARWPDQVAALKARQKISSGGA